MTEPMIPIANSRKNRLANLTSSTKMQQRVTLRLPFGDRKLKQHPGKYPLWTVALNHIGLVRVQPSSSIQPSSRFPLMKTSRLKLTIVLPSLCVCLVAFGCADSDSKSENTTSKQVAAPVKPLPEDTTAIEALKVAGFQLTEGKGGLITAATVNSDTDISESLANLTGVPNIESLGFSGPGINDKGMEVLSKLTRLVRLDLSDSAISDATLVHLKPLSNLQVLGLRRTGVTDEGLAAISGLPKVRAVDLRNSNIADAGLVHLGKLKSLADLQLEKSKVTDAGILELAGLPLKGINFNYCTTISNASMKVFGAMPTLESIQLDYTKVSDEGMAEVKNLKKLKRLRVRGCDVTGEGFAHLKGLTNLERLELRDTSLDDDGLAVIAELPKVNYLDISECRLVTPDGMKLLGKLTGLKLLGFWETKLNDDALNAMAGLTALEELNLKATSVTDECVDTILKMKALKKLNLAGTGFTDDGFTKLGQLPNLAELNVANTNIDYGVIDELAAKDGLKVIEYEN